MTERSIPAPLYAIALTRSGAKVALRIARAFPGALALAPTRFAAENEGLRGFTEPVARLTERLWPAAGGFFLVMAAGVAVRCVAPLLRDKRTDPAVVVLDAEGRFAIPILSGHLGGANDLAREAAVRLGATPVITTATDVSGSPAVEVWARDWGLRVEGTRGVVLVNAAWANGEAVGGYADPALGDGAREFLETLGPHLTLLRENEESRFPGVVLGLSHRLRPGPDAALLLRPPCLAVGVGCRRGAVPEEVARGVRGALEKAGLSALAVGVLASVDAKKTEPALCDLAETLKVPFRTFPAKILSGIAVPSPSARVAEAVGTPSVCEAAAVAAADGELIVPKVKGPSWTAAVALRPCRVWMARGADAAAAGSGADPAE